MENGEILVEQMQKSVQEDKKGASRIKKMKCPETGEKFNSGKGGGGNIVS